MRIKCRGEVGTVLKMHGRYVATVEGERVYDYDIKIRTIGDKYVWLYNVRDRELEVIK